MGWIVAKCRECGFESPRSWVNCARCGQLLGPQNRVVEAPQDELESATRKAALPQELESATDADAKTLLFRTPPSGDARPLVGRQRLLPVLRNAIDVSFRTRTSGLLALEGADGCGKTRLLARASELAARKYADVRVIYAACRTREDGPYAPFSRLLLERFGITPASSPSSVRSEMARVVGQTLGPQEATRVETTHLLGHVAGVPFPDSPFLHGPFATQKPRDLHRRACAAVRRQLRGDALNQPLLVLLDDMAQAEHDAWELLEALIGVDAPIQFIVTGSAPLGELAQELNDAGRVETLLVPELDRDEIGELTELLVPGLVQVPEAFVQALQHRTRGNPAALIELTQALQEAGLFYPVPGGVQVDMHKLASGELPLTMADTIRARLSALSPYELRVLQLAAVVGERFWDGALLALERQEAEPPDASLDPLEVWSDITDEARLHEALRSLEQKGFIDPIGGSEVPGLAEFAFRYGDTRGVVYEDLGDDIKLRRHACVARWLSTAAQRLDGVAAIVAPHLERAGLLGRAGRSYLKAAEEERARMRTTMALRYVDKALPLINEEDVAHRMEALHEHGSLLTTLGRYDEAYRSFQTILRLAWQLGARGSAGAALNRIARIHRQRGEHALALDHLRAALMLFRAAQDKRGVASTLDDMAQVHRLGGHLEPALMAAKEALEIRTASRDLRGQGVSLNTIGYIELDRGRFESAGQRFLSALKIREKIGDHEGAVQSRIALGRLRYHQRQLTAAIEIYERALESAREMDNHRFQSYLLNHLGEAHLANNEPDRAREALEQAKDLAIEMRDQRAQADIERNLGLCALHRGDDAAQATLESALQLAQDYGSREAIALAHRALGRMRARSLFDQEGAAGATPKAEANYRESIRVFQECGNLHEVARTQAELGYHLLERGQEHSARTLLTHAQAAMERLKLPDAGRLSEVLRG